jgi:PAP2 superfamily
MAFSERRQDLAMKIALTALALACAAKLIFSRTFYDEALIDAFFALALGSIVILHFRVLPKWRDAAWVAACTLAMAFICFRVLHFPHAVMPWFSYMGLSSLLVLAIRLIWADDRMLLLYAWVPAVLFVSSEYFASTMLQWTFDAHPRTFDIYVLMFDASLRFQPAFLAGQLYELHAWLHNASLIAYVGLAIPITMVYAGKLAREKEKAFPAMLAFLITGPIGILSYNLFPVSGPHALFGHKFPFTPLPYDRIVHVILEPVAIAGARNGMPSLHLAWTLLAWWYSRKLSPIERAVAFLFLGLTAFSTMGTGEHWFADLIAAFPFALMIRALCAYRLPVNDARRRTAFLFGLGGTLGWLLLFRYCTRLFWTSPVVPWALIAGTLALTTIRQGILGKAEDSEQVPAAPAGGEALPNVAPVCLARDDVRREISEVLSEQA